MAFDTIEPVSCRLILFDTAEATPCVHRRKAQSSPSKESRTLLPRICCRGVAFPLSIACHGTVAKRAKGFSMGARRNDETAQCDRLKASSCRFIRRTPLSSNCPQNSVRDGKKPCRNSTSMRRANSLSSLEITRKYRSLANLQKWPRASLPLRSSSASQVVSS